MSIETLPDIPPDYGLEPQVEFRVDTVNFGDGYKQRAPSGINSVSENWRVSWSLLNRDEYDQLYPFLLSRKGVTPFMWQAPWESAPRKYVCTQLSGPRPTSAMFASINATFEEDFTP